MPDREILETRRISSDELQAWQREAAAMRTWRMIQARQMIERRRPLMSTNFLK